MTKCSTWNISADLQIFKEHLINNAKSINLHLTDNVIEKFVDYYLLLCKFNSVVNLTRITEPEKAAVKHFIDSAITEVFLPATGSVVDVGSGAGFPGLVLAILKENLSFTLLDASLKRIDFLKIVTAKLKLNNVKLIHGRWPEAVDNNYYDAIISRATFSDLRYWEPASEKLKEHGSLILLRSGKQNTRIKGFDIKQTSYNLNNVKSDKYIAVGRMVKENG